VALQPDPLYPGQTDLVAGGTLGNDSIRFNPQGNSGAIQVTINGASLGTFTPSGRLIAFGQAGDDSITVAGSISLPAWLYGGDGNDNLNAGGGNSVLLGGAGDDKLIAGKGRNLVIGGTGADSLNGGSGDSILIAGTTAFDNQEAALAAILAEWGSTDSYATRVANLSGTGTGPCLNGSYFLVAGVTVLDDGKPDKITGSAGQDWFFANVLGPGVLDTITGNTNKGVVTDL
jgi:Ca2+-binding RTX toxin-like protein